MKKPAKTDSVTWRIALSLALLTLLGGAPGLRGQAAAPAQGGQAKTTKSSPTGKDMNVQEYIKLLRQNVRADKAKLMGGVMQLDADEAAKFWPIYKEYDAELAKLNDLRFANIMEYSKNYTQMTDEKADELVRNALSFLKQRTELLDKYYGRMKEAIGATDAARFVQVEHQLLMIIDLQIASELPVVGS